MLHEPIPAGDDAVIVLANALNRCRSLSDRESRILEMAICRQMGNPGIRRWSEEDDAKLLKMRKAGFRAEHIADQLDRTDDAVRSRIKLLKKKRMVQ